jgi:DNA-binding MarR family transcriptional regulator
MTRKSETLLAVIREVRTGFNRLKAVADGLHRDLAINASMRAVLEAVAAGEQTVPQIARARSVARQHIQVNVDALLEAGLVVLRDNPGHKRSAFVVPTARGRQVFATMQARERVLLDRLAAGHDEGQLAAALSVLRDLNQQLLPHLEKGESDE